MKILSCSIFRDELEKVLPESRFNEISWINAGLHTDIHLLERELEKALKQEGGENGPTTLLYGTGCHPDIKALADRYGARVMPEMNCIEALLGKEKRIAMEGNRTIVMTPAWVRSWGEFAKYSHWDETDMRMMLGRYDTIKIIDPGLSPLSDEEILAFFELVRVPIEVESITLDYFSKLMERTV